ncbi:TPA: hypothetical protein ACS74L_004041, partial [Providencia alcalifaciens]
MKITYIASTLMRAIQNNTGNLSRNTTRLSQSLLSVRNVNTQNSVRPSSFTLLSSISGPQSSQIPPAPPLPNSISGPQSSQIPPAPPLPNSISGPQSSQIPPAPPLPNSISGPQSSQIPPAPPLPNSISGPQSSQIPPAPPLPNSKDKIPGTESLLDNLKGVSGKSHGTNNGPSYMDELKSVLSKRNSYADTTDASTSSSTETLTQASSR